MEIENYDQAELLPVYFQEGDNVSVLIYPFDGEQYGEPKSDSVRITSFGFSVDIIPEEQAIRTDSKTEYGIIVSTEVSQPVSVGLSLISPAIGGTGFYIPS